MDWHSSRVTRFRYVKVDAATMAEAGEVRDTFTDGGEVEYNDLTAIKATGRLPFIRPPDVGFDYLRVYASLTQGGEAEELMLGTYIVSTPSSSVRGAVRSGEAAVYSLLQVAADAAATEPVSIPAGTRAVAAAAGYVRALGLRCVADTSDAELHAAANWKAGTSWLEVVNWLCAVAGFGSAGVDAAGSVTLARYTDPANRAPTVELSSGGRALFRPEVAYDLDIFDVPNVVIAVMSNEAGDLVATARNDDPLSVYSTVSRGREIAHLEEVSDIAGPAELAALAERLLAQKTSAVESVEVEHAFLPYQTGEVARLDWPEAGFSFTGACVRKAVSLTPSMSCRSRFRRFVRM